MKTVVLLIGMAVGVDYALFYVIRSREERHRGLSSHEALERTARTSGRTVLVSGTTVAIAMAGMFVLGLDIFNGIASGTITVIACAVAGSVTVLPAVLELLGARIDKGRIPFLPHLETDSRSSRFWPAVVDRVLRRPLLSCVVSAGLLVALALPALRLHVDKPGDEALASHSEPALATLAKIRTSFPSAAEPAIVVAVGPRGWEPKARAATGRARAARARRRNRAPAVHRQWKRPPRGIDRASAERRGRRRREQARDRDRCGTSSSLRPSAGSRASRPLSPATTAEDVDFTHQMKHGIPYVIVFVLALAFLLLLVAFRSIVVPMKAIVLNLLSVGAAYGVLVLVFQHHWAEPILGFTSNGSIISWLPLFLFVVLFGLSMDYHVFILSRVREAVDSGMTTDEAVRYGITVTAGVVTSAALVMVGVFSLFGSLSSLELKQAGVGLATAVLIDATIVRAVLLPSTMKLLGERNWYLPSFLGWLPRTGLEAPPARGPV